jgi:hypothetical protein
MEVSINASNCDSATSEIRAKLYDAFKIISKDLCKDYGGTMQHLWIDFELIQSHAERRPSWPFRFQKKVGGYTFKLTGLPIPVYENVGHYGISPDFQKIFNMPLDSAANYALSLIYESTSVLIDKKKKLGGFDAERFRRDFLSSCKKHGFQIA